MYGILCSKKIIMQTTAIEQNTKWVLDQTHSEVYFKVKHLMISTVTGRFKQFRGSVQTQGADFTTAKVRFTAEINSIDTSNEQRDAHLKNGDFFDADNHPQSIFDSERMEQTGDDEYQLLGALTIRGISKKVRFNVEFGGVTTDPWGNT